MQSFLLQFALQSSAEELQEISLQAQTFHYQRREEQNKSSFAQEGSRTRG